MTLRPLMFAALGLVLPSLVGSADVGAVSAIPLLANQACIAITSLPLDITAPGRYCLNADYTISYFNAVQIQTSNVLLDCMGHTITRSVRDAGSDGISAGSDLSGLTIQNCGIKNFDRGIRAGYRNSGLSVVNNHIDNSISIGIQAWGNGTRVIGNHVTNTNNVPGQYSTGIYLLPFEPATSAVGQVLLNNVVAGSMGDNQVVGIDVSGSQSPRIVNNQILGLDVSGSGTGASLMLSNWAQGAQTTNAQVINNTMMSRAGNVQGLVGQPALCTGNIAIGQGTAVFSSCISGTDNTLIP